MSSTLWYTPNIAIYRQILSIRVGYYELGCCINSIHSNLWIIALNFDLFRSIIGAMVGCRWRCYGRLKRPPSYQNIVLHQYSRRVQRKLVLVRCYCLLVASYWSDRLPSRLLSWKSGCFLAKSQPGWNLRPPHSIRAGTGVWSLHVFSYKAWEQVLTEIKTKNRGNSYSNLRLDKIGHGQKISTEFLARPTRD